MMTMMTAGSSGSSLRGDNGFELQVLSRFQDGKTVYYSLSRTAFDSTLQASKKHIRDFLTADENKRLKELAVTAERVEQ